MFVDTGLRLATAEVTPNGGAAPGGLGAASVALALDPSGLTTSLRSFADIGSGERLLLNFNVDTAFTCATFGATLEFQLVSLPINATLLTSAATSGKTLTITGLTVPAATDVVTVAGHGLPLGTPVYFSAGAGGTGLAQNTIYYTVPVDANTFKLAASLANALAGTTIDQTVADFAAATLVFIPTIHAASGLLPLYNVGTPTNQGPLRLRTQFQIPIRPLATLLPKQALPAGQTVSQPLGGGPVLGLIAANAQRFYYLRYVPSATITAGAVTCDLVLDAGDALKHYPSGFAVI